MSKKVYLITFSAILLLYMLRQSYSFGKPYLKAQYKLTHFFMSLLDAIASFFMGIGFLLRFLFFKQGHPIKILGINGAVMCFFYLCFPMLHTSDQQSPPRIKHLLIGCSCLFGFLQSFFLPALRKQFKKFYSHERNECTFDCWFSSANLGRVAGLIYMNITITELKISLMASFLILTVAMIIQIALLYYYFVIKEEEILKEREVQLDFLEREQFREPTPPTTQTEFLQFTLQCLTKPQIQHYLLLANCLKSMHRSFLYWLPTYLFSHNYKEHAGNISLVFVVPIFAGSFLMGKMYEHTINKKQRFCNACVFLSITSLLALVGLIVLNIMSMNYFHFATTIFLEGIMIGGSYNILRQNEKIMANFNAQQKEMFWTLIQGSTNLGTGLVNLTIGAMMRIRQQNKIPQVQQCIFIGLLATSFLSIVFLIFWIIYTNHKLTREDEDSLSSSSSS